MIAVDTSVPLLEEPQVPDCVKALEPSHPILILAATVAGVLIVAEGRGIRRQMEVLIDGLGLRVVPLDPAATRRMPLRASGSIAACGTANGLSRWRRATYADLAVTAADAGHKAQCGCSATGCAESGRPSP